MQSRSQWPRGLNCRSAAARLLRLWVRIPPMAWIFVVSVVCCQVQRSLRRADHSSRGILPLWCFVVCDLETSRMRRPWPTGGCGAKNKPTCQMQPGYSRGIILLRWTFRLFRSQTMFEMNTNERIKKQRRNVERPTYDCISAGRSDLNGIKMFMFTGLNVMYR